MPSCLIRASLMQTRTCSTSEDDNNDESAGPGVTQLRSEADFRRRAAESMRSMPGHSSDAFAGCGPTSSSRSSPTDLHADCTCSAHSAGTCGDWDPERDAKLKTLFNLITRTHRDEKLIVFSQFADTVHYLTRSCRPVA